MLYHDTREKINELLSVYAVLLKVKQQRNPEVNKSNKKGWSLPLALSCEISVFFSFSFLAFFFSFSVIFFLVINSSFTSDHLLLKFAPFGERYIFKALHKFMVYTTLR